MIQKTCLFCCSDASEIVRLMPIYRILKEQGNRTVVLQTAAQNADAALLHSFFGMPIDAALDASKQAHEQPFGTGLVDKIDEVLREIRPDIILITGGSPTTLASAMAAYSRGVPIAHVDAGIRAYAAHPDAQEKNQEIIARLAHWHFTSTEQAMCNLLEERIAPAQVFEVGNPLIDAALWTREHSRGASPTAAHAMPEDLREFLFQCRSRRLIVAISDGTTLTEETISGLAKALADSIDAHPETLAVWLTASALHSAAEQSLNRFCEAGRERIFHAGLLPYPFLVDLLARCSFVLTDVDEIQQMASAFGKPVLLTAERVAHQELIKAGGALVVGTDVARISAGMESLVQNAAVLRDMQLQASPFGDGASANRIVEILSIIS